MKAVYILIVSGLLASCSKDTEKAHSVEWYLKNKQSIGNTVNKCKEESQEKKSQECINAITERHKIMLTSDKSAADTFVYKKD